MTIELGNLVGGDVARNWNNFIGGFIFLARNEGVDILVLIAVGTFPMSKIGVFRLRIFGGSVNVSSGSASGAKVFLAKEAMDLNSGEGGFFQIAPLSSAERLQWS